MKSRAKRSSVVSDASVRARTHKSLSQWFAILDRSGGRRLSHSEMASLLVKRYRCPGWWNQMITVEYERARGKRVVHQTATGFTGSVSRTFDAPLPELFGAWTNAGMRTRWLSRAPMNITSMNKNKSVRAAWDGPLSNLDVRFYAKGRSRSQVSVERTRMKSPAEVRRMKSFWSDRLDKLRSMLE